MQVNLRDDKDGKNAMCVCMNILFTFVPLYTIASMPVVVMFAPRFLNQARPGHRPARAWFLEITFIPPKYVCVCVCVCVSTPEALNN